MQQPTLGAARSWPATRAEALRRLAEFMPRAGRDYAAQRNYDRGPADRTNVSTLAPYLRHRMVTETELLTAVLGRHSASAAQKFIAEIFWRTYWKGWLESHPAAWRRYWAALTMQLAGLDASPQLRRDYAAATAGRTGIDAFDAWANELSETNYLHNHARMWFASIWIFTLGLPWELGADFFMRHLLDGDPASNTLSWRWVAGLHTRGKTYSATRDNIRRYTGERFVLDRPLNRAAPAREDAAVPREPLPVVPPVSEAPEPTLFVVHDDDLCGDLGGLAAGVRAVGALTATRSRSPLAPADPVLAFVAEAAAEATARIAGMAGCSDAGRFDAGGDVPPGETIAAAAKRCGATRVVAAFAPVGPVREALDAAQPAIAAAGLHYSERQRAYDAVAWPAATSGFFTLRGRIPAILAELGITAG